MNLKTLCECRTQDLRKLELLLEERGFTSWIQCGAVTEAIRAIFRNPCICKLKKPKMNS